jgi:hypothetical protein
MPDVQPLQSQREVMRHVVAAAVGMENCLRGELVVPGGHLDRALDEGRLVMVADCPADHFLRVAVDNRISYVESPWRVAV